MDMLHHHVVHVTDTSDDVNDILRFANLPEKEKLLVSHDKLFTPWHLNLE